MNRKGKSLGLVDDWLGTMGFYRKNVANDETCLFRAISEQQYGCQVHHERVRKECVAFARENYEKFGHLVESEEAWHERLVSLEKHMQICDNIEVLIASELYRRNVAIFNGQEQSVTNLINENCESGDYFYLYSVGKDHYDVIYQTKDIESTGFCQSIVYRILYENIFGIKDIDDIVDTMLYKKPNLLQLAEWDEKPPNSPTKIAPFPYKIAKALDPNIYRNIEYDAWGEIRKACRLGDWYYGDDNLTQGTKCIYNNGKDDKIECYIQEILRDVKKCVVFIMATAERKLVDYDDLSPEDNAKPWPLPYRFSKNVKPLPTIEKLCLNDKKFRKDKKKNSRGNLPNKAKAFLGAPLRMQPSTSTDALNTSGSDYGNLPQYHTYTGPPTSYNPFMWPAAPDMIESVFAKTAPTTPVTSYSELQWSEPQNGQNGILESTGGSSDRYNAKPKLSVNISAPNPPVEIFSPINPLIGTQTVYATTPMQEMQDMFAYPTTPVLITAFSPTPQYMYPPTPPPAWLPYSTPNYPAFTFPPC